MNDSQHDARRQTTSRRLLRATALGVILIAAGYGVYRTPLVRTVCESIGATLGKAGKPAKTPQRPARPKASDAVLYARARMSDDRTARLGGKLLGGGRTPMSSDGYHVPPSEADIPGGPYGDAVRRGRDIFTRTGRYVKDHVGNDLSCDSCHLEAGRRANAAPMWAAYGAYPAYRSTTGSVSTIEDRIAACFTYSMNAQGSASGKAPAPGSEVYRDLVSYMAWLARGTPVGETLRGAGYPAISKPSGGYDLTRGQIVFQQNCALCHGVHGQGARDDKGNTTFPPLWGRASYNWGAGMAQVDMAAAFIKANMPLGNPGSLTDQQAWDVAAYIDSHERPKDPRQRRTVAEAARKYHPHEDSFYGRTLRGHLLGTGVGAKASSPAGGMAGSASAAQRRRRVPG